MTRTIRNNVRGPTSALTEFLRESGITPTTIAQRVATQQNEQTQDPVAGPSQPPNSDGEPSNDDASRNSTRNLSRLRNLLQASNGNVSDDLDEDDKEYSPAKKRQRTRLSVEKMKDKAKKRRNDDENDDDKLEEDAYTAPRSQSSSRPPIGSLETCGGCKAQFTVTKYTTFVSSEPCVLCHRCTSTAGINPFKKPAAQRKRKAPADRKNTQSLEERRFPTLVSLCIQLITKHIDDVEALGDIGTMNREVIAKALAKNRSLTPENVHLFYSIENTNLILYDCTKLTSPSLQSLPIFNPALVSLRLDFCGHLDTEIFMTMSISLPHLKRLELVGPFLVRPEAWIKFFKTHPHLEGFLVTQCPRFDLKCVKNLIKGCRNVGELRLKEMKVEDDWLKEIATSTSLKALDLSSPATSCSEQTLIPMLRAIGPKLEALDISGHGYITDGFLEDGLEKWAGSLEKLSLAGCSEITDRAVSRLFNSWTGGEDTAADGYQDKDTNDGSLNVDGPIRKWGRTTKNIHRLKAARTSLESTDVPPCHNTALVTIELGRNYHLGSRSLISILRHSGTRLESLDINGWKDVATESLQEVGKYATELKKVDVGWCRNVDDSVLAGWVGTNIPIEGSERTTKGTCLKLTEIKVWGCNKVTGKFQKRRGVVIRGIESA